MPDPARQLQNIYLAGFEIESPERFPGAIGVIKGNCMALLRTTSTGLQMIGTPGWRFGTVPGVLVEKDSKRFFQNKLQLVEATPERLAEWRAFGEELQNLLSPSA